MGEDAGERAASGCAARTSVSPAAARSPKVRMNQRRASRMHAMPRNLPRAGFQPPRARLLDQAPAVRGQSPARYLTRRSRPARPSRCAPARPRTIIRRRRPPHRKRRRSRRCSHLRRNLTRPISRVQLADVEGSMPHLRRSGTTVRVLLCDAAGDSSSPSTSILARKHTWLKYIQKKKCKLSEDNHTPTQRAWSNRSHHGASTGQQGLSTRRGSRRSRAPRRCSTPRRPFASRR